MAALDNAHMMTLAPLVSQIDAIDVEIEAIDDEIAAITIPGIGLLTASALVATVQDIGVFPNGREFAAFLGLTPRQSSSGGKERLGHIVKMGDRHLRKLLVVGACATLCRRKKYSDALRLWADRLLARKDRKYGLKLTAVALANKVARIVFALLTRGIYRDQPVGA